MTYCVSGGAVTELVAAFTERVPENLGKKVL